MDNEMDTEGHGRKTTGMENTQQLCYFTSP